MFCNHSRSTYPNLFNPFNPAPKGDVSYASLLWLRYSVGVME